MRACPFCEKPAMEAPNKEGYTLVNCPNMDCAFDGYYSIEFWDELEERMDYAAKAMGQFEDKTNG